MSLENTNVKRNTTVPVTAMKAHRKRRGITPLIFNFGAKWTEWPDLCPDSFNLGNN
jgi:hypothetical protein